MTDDIRWHHCQHQMNWCKIVIGWEICDQLMLADDVLPVETACALPYGSLEGISGHLKGVLKRLKRKQSFVCIKSRGNLKEHCCHSNLQFLIWYLREIKFFSKIFVESWIYTNQWEKIGDFNRKTFCQQDEFSKRSFTELCWKFNSLCKVWIDPRVHKWLRLLPGCSGETHLPDQLHSLSAYLAQLIS